MSETGCNLVGQFFLTFDEEGWLQWQGQILGRQEPEFYACQLFSALSGEPTRRIIEHIAKMVRWEFYDTADDWRSAFRRHFARRRP